MELLERRHVRSPQPVEIPCKRIQTPKTMQSSNSACSKCGSTERLEDHHVYPKCHFGGAGRDNTLTVKLCDKHHDRLEDIIQGIEAYTYDQPFGGRYKLEREDYERILRNFLARSKVVYIDCSTGQPRRERRWIST